jgi:glycosyltransferase involved in cell wall biosynthesis
MERWNEAPEDDVLLSWCERYACRHADLLISPNRHMFEWAQANRWELAPRRHIAPYCYEPDRDPSAVQTKPAVDTGHAIFFGRLETRKGLDIFCRAIDELLAREPGALHTVSLLGKIHTVGGVPADRYVKQQLGRHKKLNYTLHTEFDSFQALKFIKESGGFVILPSLLDNSPFTVIECIENNIPFLAGRSGGIPELAHPAVLFEPDLPSLVQALLERGRRLSAPGEHPYSNEEAERAWREVHDTPASEYARDFSLTGTPRVSVCIAHYNHGAFLPAALESLAGMDYPDFEVVAVDDGSTDPESRAVFDRLAETYPQWRFLRTENQGCGAARNHAAANSDGDWLLFFDADNVAEPSMLTDLVRGALTAGTDGLACHNRAFRDHETPGPALAPLFIYNPVGACLEFVLHNAMGDANFLVSREAFQELGGFSTSRRNSAYADWRFLARLNLAGYEHDVAPTPLYWYRVSSDSMLQQCNIYQNTRHVLDAYYDRDPVLGRLITELTWPLYDRLTRMEWGGQAGTLIPPERAQAMARIMRWVDRLFPLHSRRREWAKNVVYFFLR